MVILCYCVKLGDFHLSFLGNLTPRHKEVFLRNPLFVGMRLPEVREISPLEKKFTRISPQSLELMKVCKDNKHRTTLQLASGAGLFSLKSKTLTV